MYREYDSDRDPYSERDPLFTPSRDEPYDELVAPRRAVRDDYVRNPYNEQELRDGPYRNVRNVLYPDESDRDARDRYFESIDREYRDDFYMDDRPHDPYLDPEDTATSRCPMCCRKRMVRELSCIGVCILLAIVVVLLSIFLSGTWDSGSAGSAGGAGIPTKGGSPSSGAGSGSVSPNSGNVATSSTTSSTPKPAKTSQPGRSWTRAEVLVVKGKLWNIFSLKKLGVDAMLQELHGPGWEGGPFEETLRGTGRFVPTMIRLGFHGCLRDQDGTSGCDGCLYSDSLNRIYMDYFGQKVVPFTGPRTPNFNNGLKPVADVLEAIYTNRSFPDKSHSLPKSLYASGKSRGDLWALAAIVAVEYAILNNNMVCKNPDWEMPTEYGDSLETNGWADGKHCTQKAGRPDCTIKITNGIAFRTGRRDCAPLEYMFQRVERTREGNYMTTCPPRLNIRTEEDCLTAGIESNQEVNFVEISGSWHCLNTQRTGELCYLSMRDKYKSGPAWYVMFPLQIFYTGKNKPCRDDLKVLSKEECKKAAEYLFLPWVGQDSGDFSLDASGCFVVKKDLSGVITQVVSYSEDQPPLSEDSKNLRMICRMPEERVQGYMASKWGSAPGSQMNGTGTVDYMKREFGLSPRETVALMGAHTVGRFHARASLFRYIWVRSGGMSFNNEYFENMASRPMYRFTDPDCATVGNAFSQPPRAYWTAKRRGEQINQGPIWWELYRHMCQKDCRHMSDSDKENEPCCKDVPDGGTCKPDNGRTDPTGDSVAGDPDVHGGCEAWDSEPGNHEIMVPSEMGLFYKFNVNDTDQQESGCIGYSNFNNEKCDWYSGEGCKLDQVGCALNDEPADQTLKMHEVVELYADNQDLWVKEFHEVYEKVLQNGYEASALSEGPDPVNGIVCPYQNALLDKSLVFYSCFSKEQLSTVPFYLISEMDSGFLQVNDVTGKLEIGNSSDASSPNKLWYHAQTEFGTQLVNGLLEFGVGNMYWNSSCGFLLGGKGTVFGSLGMIQRPWSGSELRFDTKYETAEWFQKLYKFRTAAVS